MARQKPADAAKAKAAKQKKMVIVLAAVLTLAMGYAVKTMMALNGGGGSQPVAAPVTATPTPTTPAPAAAPAATPTAAPTLAGASAPLATTTAPTADLVSAARPTAGTGQLQSFSLFESKDPFAAASASGSGSSGSGSGSSGSGSGSGSTPANPPVTPPAPPAPPVTSAVISVNGVSELVSGGAAFPAANPTFQLVSLTSKSATISVIGGSYATGAPTLTLKVNKAVTLQNTADGTKYTLLLFPQGTAAPAGATTGTPTGTTTAPPAAPATPGG